LHRQQLLSLIVLLIGGSILLLALVFPHVPLTKPSGLSTHALQFGSQGSGTVGWLLPADTPISTSYTSNQSLTGFIGATLNIFPYEIIPGTILELSLYVDGQLAATQSYTLSGTYHTPATIVRTIAGGVANFSNSMLGFTVSELSLKTTLPPGTTVTVITWASSPLWAQVDPAPLTQSHELGASTSYSAVETIIEDSGSVAPYTLSVGLESNA
jgi:hypothetical protein